MSRVRASLMPVWLAVVASVAASWSCLSVQDYGGESVPPVMEDSGTTTNEGGLGEVIPVDQTWRWDWMNPAPTGRTLVALGGTSNQDLWAAGEGGTIAHFDGASWDIRHVGSEGTRYFAVGTRRPNDVHVAGTDASGRSVVTHWDGKTWTSSYPFAGSAFRTFSHGPGGRLFAVADSTILELADDGTWTPTDATAGGEHGIPVDIWVAASGEAWAITGKGWDIPTATTTIGAWFMRLAAGAQKWTLQAPPAAVPKRSVGLALSGAGTRPCAFYTGEAAGSGVAFLHYEGGSWESGPMSALPLRADPTDEAPHGPRSACFTNGDGVLVRGAAVIEASGAAAPSAYEQATFAGQSLLGALSLDGRTAYAVGALGAFMSRTETVTAWKDAIPTIRRDLLAVDVAPDGDVMVVDAFGPNRSSGGEVLVWRDGALKVAAGAGLGGPRLPIGVAVLGKDDAWVLSGDSGALGVTRWTGSWDVTRFVAQRVDGLAIFAAAKDDVWLTGRERCRDLILDPAGCSQPQRPSIWHYDGAAWKELAAESAYVSIHGTGPSDVWFAGETVAHWDGTKLSTVSSLKGPFKGVWSSAPDRVWLWGDDRAVLYDGAVSIPVKTALGASAEWSVRGIAESAQGDIFVLARQAVGTALLWFDGRTKRLVEQLTSDLELTSIRGRGNHLWAVGAGGAALRFTPPSLR